MIADTGKSADEWVPLFPLNVVLFPGGLLPLRIFEPRYLRMVSECLRGDRPFAVSAIRDGPEIGGAATTATTGTLPRIIDWQQEDDGLLGLLCEGEQAFSLDEVRVEHDQLHRARIQRLPGAMPQPVPEDLSWMVELLDDLLERMGPPYNRLALADPSADHVAARLIELLPLPLMEKQALFEVEGSVRRLRRLCGLIRPEECD